MVKLGVISRTEETSVRRSTKDITKVHRNRDPSLHPFERAREYTKALVQTKMDKMFAKPFVCAMDGHKDSVYCCTNVRNKNVPFITGACDGEVKVWDLTHRMEHWSVLAHSGYVRGVAADARGTSFFSCGDDKVIKQWALDPYSTGNAQVNDEDEALMNSTNVLNASNAKTNSLKITPLQTVLSPTLLTGIDHHWTDSQYATCGSTVQLWDSTRSSDPLHTYQWGADSIHCVKFNPSESCLLGSTAADRSVVLYDLRADKPMRKFVLAMRSNKLVWNPMEPFNFLLANEDYNIYSFDMRKLDKALMIHKDHVSAVMDVSFSPTGREFVSGSYDRTLRLFRTSSGRSRDVYHTKRMQRIYCVSYSSDSRFVISGSDDANIRVWKSDANAHLGVVAGRQQRREQVRDTIKRRYSHMPEIKRISKSQRLPKSIKKANNIRHIQNSSARRKHNNRVLHNDVVEQIKPERERNVIAHMT